MDETRPQPADLANLDALNQGQVPSTSAANPAGLYSSDMNKYYLDSSLEVKQQSPVVSAMGGNPDIPRFGGFRAVSPRKAMVISAVIALVATALTGGSILLLARNAPEREKKPQIETQDLSLKNTEDGTIPKELQGVDKSLLVNGDLITRGILKVANNSFVTSIKSADLTSDQTFTLPNGSGTFCLDNNNCSFATAAALQALQQQLGQITGAPTGTVLNGQNGSVSLQGTANRVTVATANGVITLSGPQDVATSSTPTFAGLILSSLNCSGFLDGGALTTNGSGQLICSNDDTASGGSSVGTSGGTTGVIPLFDSPTSIADSIISQSLGTITINGSLALANALSIANGGTGATSLTANGVLIGNGASAITSVGSSNPGECLISTAGAPTFQACPGGGGGGVTSINSLSGALTLQGTVNQISVNSLGSTVTLSLPQDINTSSSPQFANLTISSLGTGVVKATAGTLSAGAVNLATEVTGVLSTINGGIGVNGSVATNGQLLIGNGSGFSLNTLTAGAGVNVSNNAGSITISSPGSGTCSTCASTSLNNLASVAIQGDNLKPAVAGSINLGSNALPFGVLFLSGSSGTPGTNNFQITGNATGARTITLPNASGTVCLDTGNCAGAGGGITGSGTVGKVAKFTATGSIGDSLLSESGATMTLNGSMVINTNLTVSGITTTGSINGLTLQSNTNGFHVSGGLTPATLTVTANSTINQNLRTSDSPTFAGLTLGSPLTIANGGTGTSSVPSNGQLLIGNGASYSLANLSAGSGIVITNGAGTIQVSAPTAGTCVSGCADQSLSNLSGVNINTSLLPNNSNTIHLGSGTRPFQDLYLSGSSLTSNTNNFRFTGASTGGTRVITMADLSGTMALVQTAGASVSQTGDLNIGGNVIANRVISTLFGTNDGTTSSNVTLRSGNASAGNSGNLTIDAGTATGTAGTITLAGSNASALILGRVGLVASLPGGLTTNGEDISLVEGILDLGVGGTIRSDTINVPSAGPFDGLVFSSLINQFTGSTWIHGGLGLGTQGGSSGNLVFYDAGSSNSLSLTVGSLSTDLILALPTSLPGATECLTLDNGGQIATQSCGSGLGGGGSDNTIAMFTGGGTALADSLLSQSGTVVSILGTTNSLNVEGGISLGKNGVGGAAGILTLSDGSNPGRTVGVQAQAVGTSYTLQLPTSADVGGSCLILSNVSAGVNKITSGSCAAGGTGGNVTLSGSTNGYLLRGTGNGPSYTAAASLIQDDGASVGINTSPQSDLFTVGSSNAFRVNNSGAVTASASITSSGLINTTANNQALTVSGAPTNSPTQSLVQIGAGIASGNAAANGGTYIGLNAPNTGAGSAADLVNLQKNSVSLFRITTSGAVTGGSYNGLSLQSNATGFQVSGGTASRQLTVTANATIDQNLSTASNVAFNSLSLTSALGVTSGGTGIAGGPTADGQLLIGSAGGSYTRATITAGSGINISNGAGSIQISAPGAGTCSNCADRQLSNLTGTTSIPVDLLPSTAGTINLGSASVPYRNLYLAGTSTTPGTNNYTITGVATGARTITLPDATGTVCLTTGNCAGAGGGITGSGSTNTVPKFTGSGTIGNSNITDNGSTVGITGALTVSTTAGISGALTAGSFNALTLQANTTGFQISGGTSSKTLNVEDNVSLNQNLRTTDSPTFAALTLTAALTPANGGTGVTSTPTNGQILIGNGSGYSLNTITAGSGINISNGSGTIQISAPGGGTCATCANQALSNLSGVAVNASLIAGANNSIDIGSSGSTWRSGYFGTDLNTPILQSSGTLAVSSGTGSNLSVTSGTTGTLSLDTGSTGGINIGTNANAKTIAIGNTTGATAVTINSGSSGNGIALTSGAYNLNIRNTGVGINATTPTTGSVDLFFGNGSSRMINVNQASSGAGNSLTIQAGRGASGANAGGDLILQGGAQGTSGGQGSVVVKGNTTDSTTAFQIQLAGSAANLFTADTTNKLAKIGCGGSANACTGLVVTSATNGGVYVKDGVEITGRLIVGDSTNRLDTTSGKLRAVGSFRNTISLSLRPEFEGAILRPTGSNNVGYMISDFCSGSVGRMNINATACLNNGTGTSIDEHTYYEWTTAESTPNQEYDVYVRWRVPSNFDDASGFQNNITFTMNGWRTDSSNTLQVNLYNDAGGVCGTADQNVASATNGRWTALSFAGMAADADCNASAIDAGDYVVFRFRMSASANEFVRLGEIEINYEAVY